MWRRPWRWVGAAIDAIIWAWDMLMMYAAALFLIPLCVVASLTLLGIDTLWTALKPFGLESGWLKLLVLGAPIWLAVAAYARLAGTLRAAWLNARIERLKWAVIWTTCAGLGVFAILALLIGR